MGQPVPAGARFVDSRERADTRVSVLTLLASDLRRDTLLLWTAFFSCLLAVYLSFTWLPQTINSAGLGSATASLGLAVFQLGGVVGAIVAALLIQRFGSKGTMGAIALIAIAGALGLSVTPFTAQNLTHIMVMLAITGGAINAVQTTMYALAAHIYPTAVRATGVGAAATIGRIGAVTSSFVGVIGGSSAFFVSTAVAMVGTTVALMFIHRHVAKPP
jgi:AAHS family 4-hydroxybenzoate transporter-like MFS transporter